MLYQKSYISKVQAEILALFVSKLKDKFTISQLARELKKPYPLVHRNVSILVEDKMLSRDEHGLISLSRNADLGKLAYVESLRKDAFLERHRELKVIIEDFAGIKTDYFTLLLFGSYASGKVSKGSDMDLMVIVEKHNIERETERIASRFSTKVHCIVVTAESVHEMLQRRSENNVVNETLNNHILFFGAENYHRMVQNAG